MADTGRRARAFLSYSKYDLDWVRVLRNELSRLVSNSVDVFWDKEIEAKDTWNSFLEREVDEADHMILVATPESLASPDVQKERNLFVQRTKMERLYTVCRTKLRLPQAWTTKQLLTCRDDGEFRVVVAKLAALLRGILPDKVKVVGEVVNQHWLQPSRLPDALYQRLVDLVAQALDRARHAELASLSYALDLRKGWDAPFSQVDLKANAAIQQFLGERDPVAQSLTLLDKLDDTVVPRDAVDRYERLLALRRDIDASRHRPNATTATPTTKVGKKTPTRQPTQSDDLTRYRNAVLSSCGTMEFAGFESKVQVPIETEKLFVPLHVVVRNRDEKRDAKTGAGVPSPNELSAPLTLQAALAKARANKQRGIVILGAPGSGKSTLLRHTAWASIHKPAEFGLSPETLPVLLPLRKRQQGDFNRGLDVFLHRELPIHVGLPDDFAKDLVATCRLLVLVDGFDEVGPAERAGVVKWLGGMLRQRQDWTFVVTSRHAGYQGDARFDEHFLELELQALTDAGITRFVHQWYEAVETTLKPETGPTNAKESADDLLQKLIGKGQTSRRLLEMAGNPLLLTNVCLVHRSRGRHLPRDRHELYRECTGLLLERWPDLAQRRHVTSQKGTLALQAVALHMHRQRVAVAPQADLLPPLAAGMSLAGIEGNAEDFLHHGEHDCGLLTGWSGGRFGFMHLGFQEYLAALELARLAAARAHSGDASRAEVIELATHFGDDWWREVILLLLAIDGNLCSPFFEELLRHGAFAKDEGLRRECLTAAAQKDPTPFVQFLRTNAATTATARMVGIRGDAALQAVREFDKGMAEKLVKELPHLASSFGLGAQVKVQEREVAGIKLLAIPAGEFLMGTKKPEGHDIERPQHRVVIARPFFLARTAVTNAQYRTFVEATNYQRPEPWKDRRFNADDQPVVGVSWEDAQAFCKWAGLRLPTEAEWEYACRAETTTPFSLGEIITPEQVNYDGNYPYGDGKKGLYRERTVPVGSLPANAWGLHEMHGNVWEWCQDGWHDSYQGAPYDGSAWEEGGSGNRVLRGGSWFYFARYCRSAFRDGGPPDYREDYIGFRPACWSP